MPALGTVCSLLLLSALWVDLARVGSSSLSLKHQKVQVRHLPTKGIQEARSHTEVPRPWEAAWIGSQAESAEEELEIRWVSAVLLPALLPGSKLSGAQFLQDVLWEEARGKSLPRSGQLQVFAGVPA
uniref:Appetite-regulating hormone n=2 Tax=Bos TaxID=9903 RepID=A0A8B9XL01_BOSMU